MKFIINLLFFLFLFVVLVNAQKYRGAELRTIESFTYGRFEANFKAAYGTGILSTFFTYNDFEVCCSEWNEIDFEILGRYANDIQTTTITPGQAIYNSHLHFNYSPYDSFYTYAFEWTPDYVAWFLNGKELYRQTGEHISTLVHNQKIMMNIWSSIYDSWVGAWNEELLPFFAYYDWTAYYEYTPGSGNYGSDNNFSLLWRDDFDSLNTERWEKADHTFPGNRVRFVQENAVFQDGKMILCLTDEINTGYTDFVAPRIQWARLDGNIFTLEFTESVKHEDADNPANYAFSPTLEILDIEVLQGSRTVKIETASVDPEATYILVAKNISDRFESPNTLSIDNIVVHRNNLTSFPIKINTGSDIAYQDYLPDQVWEGGVDYGHLDGHNRAYYDIDIANTSQDSLFQTQLEEIVQYRIRVPDGYYNVQLGFAELEHQETGSRKFDLWLEDTLVFSNMDLFDSHGYAQATSITINDVAVKDGILNLFFDKWISHPVINFIVVDKSVTDIRQKRAQLPSEIQLNQNFPNPFNPQTSISYYLARNSDIKLEVYDLTGKKIEILDSGKKNAGLYKVRFDGDKLASGLYFYRLEGTSAEKRFVDYKKMILIK